MLGPAKLQSYSLTSAAKFANVTPCTNRPVPLCSARIVGPQPECDSVIWSYSMADHFALKHRSVQMPEELAKAVALKYHEKATTLELLKVYPKSIRAPTNCLAKEEGLPMRSSKTDCIDT